LFGAYFNRSDLSYTNLTNADFSNSFIIYCELVNIKEFTGLKCENADFFGSNFNNKEFVEYLRKKGAINVNDPQ
jgi:uncharacterized protein YjbI with pentapeptide repeats